MPQSSDELRAKMLTWFGDDIDETGPMNFLEDNGFRFGQDWVARKPGVMLWSELTPKEQDCVIFLMEEWDFGGWQAKEASSEDKS